MNSQQPVEPTHLEFTVQNSFNFMEAFATHFGLRVDQHQVHLPPQLGTGFIKEIHLANGVAVSVHQYRLTQPLALKRLPSSANDILNIKFARGVVAGSMGTDPPVLPPAQQATVEITTAGLFTDLVLPAHQAIDYLVLVLTRQRLLDLLQIRPNTHPLHRTLADNPSFVVHDTMTIEMERAFIQLTAIHQATPLASMLYQLKADELLYLLFSRLVSRSATGLSSVINQEDARKLYELRATLVADLSQPPRLPHLARQVGMSATKLQRLFHQIFGESIYAYYQEARMNEAARLLGTFSVAETGYRLGFVNLSHFARIFERHHHLKPKRYKDGLRVRTP